MLPTQEIACPACQVMQMVKVLEVQLRLAYCAGCGAVLPSSVLVPNPGEASDGRGGRAAQRVAGRTPSREPLRRPREGNAGKAPARPSTPQGTSVQERQGGDTLELVTPWFHGGNVFVTLLIWVFIGFEWQPANTIGMVWASPCMLAFAYYTLALLINRTTLRVKRGGFLWVQHGPLPWPGYIELHADQIDQLFLCYRPSGDYRYEGWDLVASSRDGQKRVLAYAIADKQSARVLEHRVEAFLGLQDRAVPGEDIR